LRDGLLSLYPLFQVTGSIKPCSEVINLRITSSETCSPYAPNLVEGEFSEVQIAIVLGSPPRIIANSSPRASVAESADLGGADESRPSGKVALLKRILLLVTVAAMLAAAIALSL